MAIFGRFIEDSLQVLVFSDTRYCRTGCQRVRRAVIGRIADPSPIRLNGCEKVATRPLEFSHAGMEEAAPSLRVFDAVKALAFVGDLSMGQPTDHSLRTAWFAGRLAGAVGLSACEADVATEAALLRWSGCTANASGFADLLGDDVAGREAMLAMRPNWVEAIAVAGGVEQAVAPLARIHCEVSGEIGNILGLGGATENTLRHIFEAHDGSGMPQSTCGRLGAKNSLCRRYRG